MKAHRLCLFLAFAAFFLTPAPSGVLADDLDKPDESSAPTKEVENPGGAKTPEKAFENIRQTFAHQQFHLFWAVMTDAQQAVAGGQFGTAIEMTFAQVAQWQSHPKGGGSMFTPEQAKALAILVKTILKDRTKEQVLKLGQAEQWGIVLGIQDAQYRARGRLTSDVYKIFSEKAKIVSKKVEKETATLLVESPWKYRRKRSEAVFVKQGASWRMETYRLHVVGPDALGEKGLTVSDAKKRELVEKVRQMILAPRRAQAADLEEVKEIGPVAVPTALSFLKNSKATRSQGTNAFAVLEALGEEAGSALPELKKMLVGDNKRGVAVACKVIELMPRAGADAAEAMLVPLGKGGRNARVAAKVLGTLKAKPEIVVPALVAALEGKEKDLAAEAGRALAKYGDAARPALPQLKKMLASGQAASVNLACGVIVKMPTARAEAVPELLALLKSKKAEKAAVSLATAVLGQMKERADLVVPILTERLSGSDQVAGEAARALAQYGDAARPARPQLKKMLASGQAASVNLACGVIVKMPTVRVELVPALVAVLKSDKAENGALRAVALALGQIKERADLAVPALSQRLTGDKTVVAAAAHALGSYGEAAAAAVPQLRKMLAGDDEPAVLSACQVLYKMPLAGGPAVPELIALLKQKGMLPVYAAATLGHIQTDPEATIPALAEALNGEPQLAMQAVQALGEYGAKAAPAMGAVGKLLSHKEVAVRKGVVQVLIKFGPLMLKIEKEVRAAEKAETDPGTKQMLHHLVKQVEKLHKNEKAQAPEDER